MSTPRSPMVGSLSERVDWLGDRVGAWLDAVVGGGVSNDPLVFALAMGGLAWLLGLITAWLVFRDNAPWLAIVIQRPGAADEPVVCVADAGGLRQLVRVLLRACCWPRSNWRTAPSCGGARSSTCSWRVVVNVLLGTALAVGGLLSVAWALPANVASPAVATGWSQLTSPWQGMEGEFDRWFAALNGSDRNARGLSFGRTLAPRGAFDLGDTPVLEVEAVGAAVPARDDGRPLRRPGDHQLRDDDAPTSTPTPTCCPRS